MKDPTNRLFRKEKRTTFSGVRPAAALLALLLLSGTLSACRTGGGHGTDTAAETVTDTTPADTTLTLPTDTAGDDTAPVTEREETHPRVLLVPAFSHPGGLTEGAFDLTLTLPDEPGLLPEGVTIRYSLDGSLPAASSPAFDAPIRLLAGDAVSAVVRAALFAEGKQLGHVITRTYIKSGTTTLRVVALTVDPSDLYDKDSGILANRQGSGCEWERPASVEIYQPDGTCLIAQDAGIRLSGAGSRTFDPASLRLIARKDTSLDPDGLIYDGAGKFKAALFPGEDCASYDRLLLRNGGNDSLHQARSGFLRMNMMRDAVANNLCAALEAKTGVSVFAQRSVPAAVFLNGEYYGMLCMKQDFGDHLVDSLYGLNADDVAVIKGKKNGKSMYYQVESGTDGDLADWQALVTYAAEHALSADYGEAYARLSSQMDVENYTWYMAVMTYLCNTDWPQNNTMVWRYAGADSGQTYADGKWRFVIRDMDLCFALHDKASQTSSTTYTMADTDTLYRLLVFYRDGNGYTYDASTGLYEDVPGFQGLFDFFMRSADFREGFRKACEYLMSGEFADMANAEIDACAALCRPEIPAHLARWQAAGEISTAYSMKNWTASVKDMKTFVKERPGYFRAYLEKAFAYYE